VRRGEREKGVRKWKILRTNGFAADDLAKDDVLSIEVRRGGACDEELRAVGVGASISLRAVG